ncbi:hypothetical protein U1Q18_000567, partial [Sarracenia purpurea var. burkii]
FTELDISQIRSSRIELGLSGVISQSLAPLNLIQLCLALALHDARALNSMGFGKPSPFPLFRKVTYQ